MCTNGILYQSRSFLARLAITLVNADDGEGHASFLASTARKQAILSSYHSHDPYSSPITRCLVPTAMLVLLPASVRSSAYSVSRACPLAA